MRVRLLNECAQLKPSLSEIFVRRKRGAEHAYPSEKNPSSGYSKGWAGPSYTEDCLTWHGDQLLLRAGRRLLAAVERDSEWPGMWRVRLLNGDLSDMANRTRAKDAAQLLALATLNSAQGKLHETIAPRRGAVYRDR
jgi:hypothetical protein